MNNSQTTFQRSVHFNYIVVVDFLKIKSFDNNIRILNTTLNLYMVVVCQEFPQLSMNGLYVGYKIKPEKYSRSAYGFTYDNSLIYKKQEIEDFVKECQQKGFSTLTYNMVLDLIKKEHADMVEGLGIEA